TLLTSRSTNLLLNLLTLILPIYLFYYIHTDYKAFLSLGPGGTPSTPAGYAKLKLLSLFCLRNPLTPIPIPSHYRPQTGYLSSLPQRPGPRPEIRGIAPQRQLTARSPPQIYNAFLQRLRALAADPANALVEKTSCFEKHSSAFFAKRPITGTCRCGGEVCHVHACDGSLHLSLHPADVGVMIASGRGERHPLAKGGWMRRFVPKEFCLVYAPRDEKECEVVLEIVRASVWWVSGVDVRGEGKGESR
ncbi:hypothetical protein M011DRAFT_387894, partial [Sporormia fimetaria CBS 119925]